MYMYEICITKHGKEVKTIKVTTMANNLEEIDAMMKKFIDMYHISYSRMCIGITNNLEKTNSLINEWLES